MAILLLILGINLLTFILIMLTLSIKLKKNKEKEYWCKINSIINDYNNFEFIGGPCDGEWKFLPKNKSIFVYRQIHQYNLEEINDNKGARKVYKYIR